MDLDKWARWGSEDVDEYKDECKHNKKGDKGRCSREEEEEQEQEGNVDLNEKEEEKGRCNMVVSCNKMKEMVKVKGKIKGERKGRV
jgi:hypothetical protein